MEPCQLPTCLKIGMSPVGLHVGPLNIYWYGALVAIGFVAAIRLASREAEREKLDSDQLLSAMRQEFGGHIELGPGTS